MDNKKGIGAIWKKCGNKRCDNAGFLNPMIYLFFLTLHCCFSFTLTDDTQSELEMNMQLIDTLDLPPNVHVVHGSYSAFLTLVSGSLQPQFKKQ